MKKVDALAPEVKRTLAVASLLALVFVAAWLRWLYARTAMPHVDEYITLWAAQQTLEQGIPRMPSGVIYPRGLVVSYLVAALGAGAGVTLMMGRLLNIFFGVAAVGLTLVVGWQSWRFAVGLLAAVSLALAPEAVQWSGSARFYAPMQFFALLTVAAAFCVVSTKDGTPTGSRQFRRCNLFFALAFVLALLSQEVTVFLYPPLWVATIWWRGWRFLLQPWVLAAHLLCVAAIGARFVFDLAGQPGQLAAFQNNRPYVSLLLDLPGAWAVYGPLLLGPERLPLTVGAGIALFIVAFQLVRVRGTPQRMPLTQQATLFFALPALFTLGMFLTVAGGEWREARFFLAIQPLWLLVGAAGAVALIRSLPERPAVRALAPPAAIRGALLCALVILLVGASWSPVQRTVRERGNGLAAALAYVAEHRRPGEIVLTSQPSACAFVVSDCTYYARQAGFEPYVIEQDGVIVDRYAGLPLLNTVEQLTTLLERGPVVWFVVDRDSLFSTRYGATYLATVIRHFDLVFEERRGLVLRTAARQTTLPVVAEVRFDPPVAHGPLLLTAWQRSAATPGRPLDVTLFWRTEQRLPDQLATSVQVTPRTGLPLEQDDGPIARGVLPLLPASEPLPDPKRLILPDDLPPDRYRLDVIAYTVGADRLQAEQPLALDWFWVGASPGPPAVPMGATWVNGIELVGHQPLPEQLEPGATVVIELQWKTAQPIRSAYTVFVHLVGPDGQLAAQQDRQPEDGFYPTWGWRVNEAVIDHYPLALPARLPPGEYLLLVGWYDPLTGERLAVAGGADTVRLAEWRVE